MENVKIMIDPKIIALAQYLELDFCKFNNEYYYGATQEELDKKLYQTREDGGNFEEWLKDLSLLEDKIQVSKYDDCLFEYGNQEYLIYTDSEADDAWEQELDNYLEECIYPELQGNLKNYFDDEKWKRDARYDGRGHSLGRYDGCEYEEKVEDVWYYIYRQN